MELTQLLDRIRAQCDQSRLPGPGQRHISSGTASHLLPGLQSHVGAAAASAVGGAASEVATLSRIFSYAFVLCLCHGTPGPLPARHTLTSNSRLVHNKSRRVYDLSSSSGGGSQFYQPVLFKRAAGCRICCNYNSGVCPFLCRFAQACARFVSLRVLHLVPTGHNPVESHKM